jgi:hypothetical protein
MSADAQPTKKPKRAKRTNFEADFDSIEDAVGGWWRQNAQNKPKVAAE